MAGSSCRTVAGTPGEGVGGLLNATFGNAAELIIALAGLRAGFYDVVSIDNRVDCRKYFDLLGASMLAGGLRHTQATMLTLVAIALILPAAFQAAPGAKTTDRLNALSVSISIVPLLVCLLYLAFALITYSALFAGFYAPGEGEAHANRQ